MAETIRDRWHIHITPPFRTGDPPPTGYCEWHEWARVQHRAGLRQTECPRCGKWIFPQEQAGHHDCGLLEATNAHT